jgi:predicted ATP-grasp superfamily ATP-dependent carboligase
MLEMQLHIDLLEDSVEDIKNKLNKSLELTKNARKKCKTESETSEKYLQEIKDEKEINKALVERIQ